MSWQQWLTLGVIVFVSGCASDNRFMLAELDQQRGDVELVHTPFYPQVSDQCGPSALAAVLNSSGVTVTPESLKSRIYIPGRQGSLQIELLAATRGYERMPYLIDTNVSAILAEVRAGRPVLVLQNLGSNRSPIWHYAVVVGYLADKKQFVVRSGDQERHLMRASQFVRTWQRAGYWGILALQPGEQCCRELPRRNDALARTFSGLVGLGQFVLRTRRSGPGREYLQTATGNRFRSPRSA